MSFRRGDKGQNIQHSMNCSVLVIVWKFCLWAHRCLFGPFLPFWNTWRSPKLVTNLNYSTKYADFQIQHFEKVLYTKISSNSGDLKPLPLKEFIIRPDFAMKDPWTRKRDFVGATTRAISCSTPWVLLSFAKFYKIMRCQIPYMDPMVLLLC